MCFYSSQLWKKSSFDSRSLTSYYPIFSFPFIWRKYFASWLLGLSSTCSYKVLLLATSLTFLLAGYWPLSISKHNIQMCILFSFLTLLWYYSTCLTTYMKYFLFFCFPRFCPLLNFLLSHRPLLPSFLFWMSIDWSVLSSVLYLFL